MTTTLSVIGTIATDPRLINPASGTTLCSFRLASDERRFDKDKQEWVDGDTNWFGVVAFRGLGTHAHESFRKGDRVMVSGRLRMRSWEKDDRRGVSVEIEADALGHDVRWGISRFEKRVGNRGDADADTAQPGTADANTAQQEPVDAQAKDIADLASPNATPADVGWVTAAA